jgi:hypothetical protein
MNSDEIYQNLDAQVLVIMMPDHPDSDDLIINLVLERTEKHFAAFIDINKKSEIQVRFTEAETSARSEYIFTLS